MALAKYYEEILERLFEENTKLTEGLWPEDIPDRNYVEHVRQHLGSSRILLDELLEMLTNPASDDLFASVDRSQLIKQRTDLLSKIDGISDELAKKKELIDSLNSECNILQRRVDKLEAENKEINRALKKKRT